MTSERAPRWSAAMGLALACAVAAAYAQSASPTAGHAAKVDAIFARWSDSTPGCAVGVSLDDRVVLSRAYGMADLERGVKNAPDTIFEAGSVSKQFTAAAILLLARDGRLSLDDPVRKYVPELPEYGMPLTIRHLLTHTSGLRDWGSVAAVAGWPRTSRAYTHAHVLDIVSRQRTLNFPAGTRYSYSNTGYNLSAIIVSRVSGQPFAEFSAQRIFKPLGMSRTSWRDDHQRVVPGRALAYAASNHGYRTLMPFENVHGNGGLLTTVGDLLTWNRNFTAPVVGGEAFVREMETPGRFTDGRVHGYALGLMVGSRHGLREVAHSGSTAGYRAHLTRFPDQRVSVSVLCNGADAEATRYANDVADVYLASHITSREAPAPVAVPTADLDRASGRFRNLATGEPVNVTRVEGGIRLERTSFAAVSGSRFANQAGDTWQVVSATEATLTDRHGSVERFERVAAVSPSPAALQELTGTYRSDEAEVELTLGVEDGMLTVTRRPDTVMRLTPVYADAFAGPLGTIVFRRGSGPLAFSVVQDRVWDLRFTRTSAPPASAPPGHQTDRRRDYADIDAIVTGFVKREHVPGAAWGLVVDGKLVHAGAVGRRELASGSPVTPDTVFRIASMTKSFTAMAIMKLRDEGKLSLDDPAEQHVPELRGLKYPTSDSPKITIRHLLSHAEGFPEDNPWGDQQLAVSEDDFSRMMRQGIPFSNPPGVAYEYSNYGFAILGRIVANVSKMPYRDYVAAHVLRPLGMNATTLEPRSVPAGRLAHGYRWEDERWKEEPQLPDGAFGAMGGMLTSLADLAAYVGVYLGAWPPRDGPESGPVSRASLREMQQVWRTRPATAARDAATGALQLNAGGYGYGLRVSQSCDYGHIVAHSGGLPGFGSLMQWLPEYGVGFIAMGNRTYTSWGGVATQVFDRLRETGRLQPRSATPSPALVEARDAVSRLVNAWDDELADRVAAVNLFLDRSKERRRREIEGLRATVGACEAPSEFTFVENALRGTWRMTCEKGALDVAVTLAPTMPPAVQFLDVSPARPQVRAACRP